MSPVDLSRLRNKVAYGGKTLEELIEKYRAALVAIVQLNQEMDESINKAGYATGGEAGHYFYKAAKVAKEALKP